MLVACEWVDAWDMVIEANEKITVITEVDKLRREWKELGSGVDIPALLRLLSDQVPMEARWA